MQTTFQRSYVRSAASRLFRLPDAAIQRIAGDPIEVDGRVLNRHLQLLLALGERSGASALEGKSVAERRRNMSRASALGMPIATGLHVSDRLIPGPETPLRVRVYRPYGTPLSSPAVVYYHGGGWVVGDIDSHDGSCRLLALHGRCVVVSVDYRLAPEHPFPAPIDDCVAAYEWVVNNAEDLSIDPASVGVMGDSAGGNLAAVVAQLARHLDVPPPVAQGLIYPSTDFRLQTRSVELLSDGFMLTRESMDWFRAQYLHGEADITDPRVSPLLAEDLSDVAPAWVWTAGFDPLRDEGRAYADALTKAGVPARYRCYDDQIHGFFGMGIVPGGLDIVVEVCTQMGELLRGR